MLQTARSYLDKDEARVAVELGQFASRIKQGDPRLYDKTLQAPFDNE